MTSTYHLAAEADHCYRAVQSRDRRFDGVFYTAVRTTGIYCRPSCPAVTPRRKNVEFFRTAAAAQGAGYRACKRCRPDLTPGSPEWDVSADVAGRVMRLIADGVVEREGVSGLARRLSYTERHLNRLVTEQLGAGPLALARARRAQTARLLIETTAMGLADIAFASGFSSVRQFNATIQEVFATTPSRLRGRRRPVQSKSPGVVAVSLPVREPFAASELLGFLRLRAVRGIECTAPGLYARTLRLPHGVGAVELRPGQDRVECTLRLADLRDVGPAVERCRRLLDLDADPEAVDDHLSADPVLGPWVLKRPGIRVPGHVDGFEIAVRAVVGQQISVTGASTVLARMVASYGAPLDDPHGSLTDVFPTPEALAAADPTELPMPRARGRCIVGLAAAVAEGLVVLDRSADRAEARQALVALPGVGPWTADYIALRALGDPDVFLATDLGVRHGLARMGVTGRSAEVAEAWRPWRSYAQMHVWASLSEEAD